MVMDGRFFGRASCGPDGGGEVALPGGLLAMLQLARLEGRVVVHKDGRLGD
jgi:hypothetical protein